MTQLGVGLFTIRDLDEPVPETLKQVAELGYDGVEFVDRVNHEMDFQAVEEALEETGIEPLSVHLWLHQLEDDLETLVDDYSRIGVDTFVIPYHPETNFRNRRRMQSLADRITAVAERAADRGFDLVYHPNHWDLLPMFNGPIIGDIPSLRTTDPVNSVSQDLTVEKNRSEDESLVYKLGRGIENEVLRRRNAAFDRAFLASGTYDDNDAESLIRTTPLGFLVDEIDPELLSFQIDVSFVLQQGYEPAHVLSELSNRIDSVHAKDVRTDEYTPGGWPSFVDPGEGDVDFDSVVDAAVRNDIDWVIFENGHAEEPLESIRSGLETLGPHLQ